MNVRRLIVSCFLLAIAGCARVPVTLVNASTVAICSVRTRPAENQYWDTNDRIGSVPIDPGASQTFRIFGGHQIQLRALACDGSILADVRRPIMLPTVMTIVDGSGGELSAPQSDVGHLATPATLASSRATVVAAPNNSGTIVLTGANTGSIVVTAPNVVR